jgi:hypothetical protein
MNARTARFTALMQELAVLERKASALEEMSQRVCRDANKVVADYKTTIALVKQELAEVTPC